MASPFSVFRKNQKAMMAVITILAMFAFVFIPILMEQIGSSKVENPVAVKTSAYGDLHERDLRVLLDDHRRVLSTLTDLMQMGGVPAGMATRIVDSGFGHPTMETVVENWLLTQRAAQMGMVISNPTINAWLKMVTQDSVSAANFQAIFRRHGLSDFQFFKLMRDELAARQMKSIFETSVVPLTPAQRWEYFCRMKQMATIEAVAVPVANYLKRVDEPNDETLKAFFEQYKERYPMPDSPTPGFREPERVALEYLKADLDKFAASVTEEEVKAHYAALPGGREKGGESESGTAGPESRRGEAVGGKEGAGAGHKGDERSKEGRKERDKGAGEATGCERHEGSKAGRCGPTAGEGQPAR